MRLVCWIFVALISNPAVPPLLSLGSIGTATSGGLVNPNEVESGRKGGSLEFPPNMKRSSGGGSRLYTEELFAESRSGGHKFSGAGAKTKMEGGGETTAKGADDQTPKVENRKGKTAKVAPV